MQAFGVLLAGTHAIQRLLHPPAPAAGQAHHGMQRAVHFDHFFGGHTGALVQAVNVLGDQCVQPAAPLQFGQCTMAGIGRCGPRRMRKPRLPRQAAHFGIRCVITDVGHALGLGVERPHALGSAEIRNTGVGGNARAGEHDHALRSFNPVTDGIEFGIAVHAPDDAAAP